MGVKKREFDQEEYYNQRNYNSVQEALQMFSGDDLVYAPGIYSLYIPVIYVVYAPGIYSIYVPIIIILGVNFVKGAIAGTLCTWSMKCSILNTSF